MSDELRPDEMTARFPATVEVQLVQVRSLLERARTASAQGDDAALVNALLLADVAIETAVRQALVYRNVTLPRRDNLATRLELLANAVPGLAGRAELAAALRVRAARNPVQHAGHVPDATAVDARLADANEFLRLLVRECFGMDFGSISLAHLVKTEDLNVALTASFNALHEGRRDQANLFLAAAYESLSVGVRHWTRRARGMDTRMEEFAGVWLNEIVIAVFGPDHPDATMTRLEAKPRDHQALLGVGFPLADVIQLQKLSARALAYVRSLRKTQPEPLTGDPPTAAEIELGLDVLSRQITRLEGTQPDLFAPRRSIFAPPDREEPR